jgi:hypothetical protein
VFYLEVSVSDDLMASNTLGLIGFEVYRLHVGPVAAGVKSSQPSFRGRTSRLEVAGVVRVL